MVRQMVYVLVLCWCVLTISLRPSQADQAREIAERVQAYYEATKSFVADFEQEVHWHRGQEVRLSRGKVWFKKPGLMRWEYVWPEPLLVVCDGQKIYVYSEIDRQVMIFPSGKALSPKVTLGFMSGKGNLLRDFDIRGMERLDSLVALDVAPKTQNPQVEKLRLLVDPKTGAIKEIWFWDYLGNLTKIRFRNLQRNVDLPPELFVFHPPKDVEIIRER
ncbi:MAG: outer membrane lipoprotein carrier protein LolA [Thermodesulfobacteria bacterium]|nr:outer membrane lipoprotein carrier protein LolA [Thermodesulfobacteriota bacterium]